VLNFPCQAMTVSGLTMTSHDRQSGQAPDNHAHKKDPPQSISVAS
jgi:hypothetical protein